MRVYFIFDLKDEYIKLYTNNERVLYNILKQIYYLDKEKLNIAYNLFQELANPINKNDLDRKLFIKFHQDVPYSKKGNTHYINNLYRDEISRLEVKRSYLKLELEQNFSSFLDILLDFSSNYFACDFVNQDYFFLKNNLV